MKKLDGFFITILSLFLTLGVIYFYAEKTLNYFEDNVVLKTKYERQKSLLSLKSRLKAISEASLKQENKTSSKREVASISPVASEPTFAVDENLDSNEQAKKYYIEAKARCYELNKEFECIKIIDTVVTHFPDSDWTAESLVLLTDFYYRTKRLNEARDVLNILKTDFKNSKSIQNKIVIIERHLI